MKRRSFIKRIAPLGLLPITIQGQSIKTFASNLGLSSAAFTETDNVLVLIQLNGGNDGLNTIIPLDQYDNLTTARPNLYIRENKVAAINGSNKTGFHPALDKLKNLYNEGKVSVIQNVGYPDQDFSHFRSTDIWLTGADSNQYLTSGWAGRYLNEEWPNYPNGFPNNDMPDPLAIQIGSTVSTVCQGLTMNMGFSVNNVSNFYELVDNVDLPYPNTRAGHELHYVRTVAKQSNEYSVRLREATQKAKNLSTKYPAGNSLANQLKVVAQLIAGGMKTRIYVTTIHGFDTHADQIGATGGSDQGVHANLLKNLSEAIDAFQDDLKLLKVDNRVTGMTFSEFGRRIVENGSIGTDHGSSAPLIVFGEKVKGGLTNDNPIIPKNATVHNNLDYQTDFRSVYATILQNWFCISEQETENILYKKYPVLPILDESACQTSSIERAKRDKIGDAYIINYPNPCRSQTTFKYYSEGHHVSIIVMDIHGRILDTIVDSQIPKGSHEIQWDTSQLPAGTYYYRFQTGANVMTKSLLKY
jgi:uncharacterized protein (DUF1501 family)